MEKQSVSKNFWKGEQITDAQSLMETAKNRGSVYHSRWRVRPAAFIVEMPFRVVMNSIRNNYLFFIIRKKEKQT